LTRAQENNAQLKSIGQIYDNVFKNLENDYKSYENQYFKEHGTVKGQNFVNGLVDRLSSLVLEPFGMYLGNSLADFVRSFEIGDYPSVKVKDYSKYGGGLK
jgi:hypothetical protein